MKYGAVTTRMRRSGSRSVALAASIARRYQRFVKPRILSSIGITSNFKSSINRGDFGYHVDIERRTNLRGGLVGKDKSSRAPANKYNFVQERAQASCNFFQKINVGAGHVGAIAA